MLSRSYSIKELAKIIQARIVGNSDLLNLEIDKIATDSRYQGIGYNSCFFAIENVRNDGHDFIGNAFEKEVKCFVVHKDFFVEKYNSAVFLIVEDTLRALQQLAAFHRNELKYPIVGITGSNGKTVVKEWLFQILSSQLETVRSPKSYNSQIGVPLSLINFPLKADVGLIEAGISKVDEMNKLQAMVNPDIGILTNVHNAHLENFKNRDQLISEKIKLFKNCQVLIYRKDYNDIDKVAQQGENQSDQKILSWSSQKNVKSSIKVEYEEKAGKTKISVFWKNEKIEAEIPFVDKASTENATHCMIAAKYLGVSNENISLATKVFPSIAMRLQQLQGINNCTLINDSYNSDLMSLEIALNYLNIQLQHKKKTIVLSDIFQSGMPENELYSLVDKLCKENDISRIIGVGKSISKAGELFTIPFQGFQSTELMLEELKNISFYNEAILLKGARIFEFERISNHLEYKKHETTLEINLSALIDNLNLFKLKLKPNVKLMAMVKAFSYGTGSYEIANVLEHHGVDYLAVAYIDEGIVLRNRGIKAPIMVMNPSMGELKNLVEHNLEPELFSLENLHVLDTFTKETGYSVKVHLKIESGMHRLGLEGSDLADSIAILKRNNNLIVATVFSHLVGSDNEQLDSFTLEQISKIELAHKMLNEAGIGDFKIHMLNSDGIIRFHESQYDMVRLGIGLYGITSIQDFKSKLRSVISLKSRISQIKNVKKGESVGYSREYMADRDMKTATIAIGYADGLARDLGKGNWNFMINGQKAPIVGNICMDMTMVDVTHIENVREKDEVIIFDNNDDIYAMAKKRNTIPYEILTSFSERVKRIYYYGD